MPKARRRCRPCSRLSRARGPRPVAVARYYWRADKPLFTVDNELFTAGDGAVLEITSEVRRPQNGDPASFLSTATLKDFSITLLPATPLAVLTFSQVQFTAAGWQEA